MPLPFKGFSYRSSAALALILLSWFSGTTSVACTFNDPPRAVALDPYQTSYEWGKSMTGGCAQGYLRYSYTGALPPGLSFNTEGTIVVATGIPTAPGSYTFTVTGRWGPEVVFSRPFTIVVDPAPFIPVASADFEDVSAGLSAPEIDSGGIRFVHNTWWRVDPIPSPYDRGVGWTELRAVEPAGQALTVGYDVEPANAFLEVRFQRPVSRIEWSSTGANLSMPPHPFTMYSFVTSARSWSAGHSFSTYRYRLDFDPPQTSFRIELTDTLRNFLVMVDNVTGYAKPTPLDPPFALDFLSPAIALPGTTILVKGSGLMLCSPTASTRSASFPIAVRLGDVVATDAKLADCNTIQFTLPPLPVGATQLTVTLADGRSASLPLVVGQPPPRRRPTMRR